VVRMARLTEGAWPEAAEWTIASVPATRIDRQADQRTRPGPWPWIERVSVRRGEAMVREVLSGKHPGAAGGRGRRYPGGGMVSTIPPGVLSRLRKAAPDGLAGSETLALVVERPKNNP
jgi:hypothetical protein